MVFGLRTHLSRFFSFLLTLCNCGLHVFLFGVQNPPLHLSVRNSPEPFTDENEQFSRKLKFWPPLNTDAMFQNHLQQSDIFWNEVLCSLPSSLFPRCHASRPDSPRFPQMLFAALTPRFFLLQVCRMISVF